jgi:amidase
MEIWELGAARLAAAIRSRELSSREVVAAHLERIEAVNPTVNALRVVLAEQALAAADEADRRPADQPLHGVPVSVKENVDVAGTATTWGVPALEGAIAPLDAPAVANLRAAGAVVLGRGHMAATPSAPRADRAAARRRRSPPAWLRSRSPTTSAARCASPRSAAGSPRCARRTAGSRTQA